MQYVKSESNIRPAEVEAITGGRYLIRKNITEVTKEDNDGNKINYFEYEEAIATEAEFAAFATAQAICLRHDEQVIDEYTMQLISEGVL